MLAYAVIWATLLLLSQSYIHLKLYKSQGISLEFSELLQLNSIGNLIVQIFGPLATGVFFLLHKKFKIQYKKIFFVLWRDIIFFTLAALIICVLSVAHHINNNENSDYLSNILSYDDVKKYIYFFIVFFIFGLLLRRVPVFKNKLENSIIELSNRIVSQGHKKHQKISISTKFYFLFISITSLPWIWESLSLSFFSNNIVKLAYSSLIITGSYFVGLASLLPGGLVIRELTQLTMIRELDLEFASLFFWIYYFRITKIFASGVLMLLCFLPRIINRNT